MPNRVIRESMLDSSRYLSVNDSARLLYHQILLLADDFGCLSVEHQFIGRRCFDTRPADEVLDGLVYQLAEADLIRLYKYRNQRFAFIPRFRQRLKRETLKNPQPPDELLFDDLEAQDKFRRLNGHQYKGSSLGTAIGPPPGGLGMLNEPKEATELSQTREYVQKEVVGSGVETDFEKKAAPAGDSRSAVDAVRALAEKMRLKNNSQD